MISKTLEDKVLDTIFTMCADSSIEQHVLQQIFNLTKGKISSRICRMCLKAIEDPVVVAVWDRVGNLAK